MITITFKNVDQGDSIILEYIDKGVDQTVIIDCNRAFGSNPVLDHLKAAQCKRIKLMLLTHPHLDHLSGFSETIRYCIDNNISIEHFLHTANNMPSFWKAAFVGVDASNKAIELFRIIREASEKIQLRYATIQGESPFDNIQLTEDIAMKVLAPTSTELDSYAAKYIDPPFEEEIGNNPNANLLSTLIKIYSKNWFVLLTSDVEKSVLRYYGIKQREILSGNLVLGQSPHHGAAKNHVGDFWKHMTSSGFRGIVFSVGKNSYSHPSSVAIDSFIRNKYRIYSTNETGSLHRLSKKAIAAIAHLDVFSTHSAPRINDQYNGDKVFKIDFEGRVTTG